MCGIWSYSGNNFNKYKFNILGLFNDSRGGDSCGVFIGNKDKKQLAYGSDKTKLYADFIASGVELDFNNVNFALGHCRKASVGGIGHAQAQPVVIKDNDGKAVFVMIHNGTLINYKTLADKYNVDYLHRETDSQIFAKVIWRAGYDVLGEYDGAGAFIFWDSRDGDDSIKFFKGASLYYDGDPEIYVERPLYLLKNDKSMWISSIESSLKFINDQEYKVEDVECNTLYTVVSGSIIGEESISRAGRQQLAVLQYKPKVKSTSVAPWDYNRNSWDGYWGTYDNDYNYNKYNYGDKIDDSKYKDPSIIDYKKAKNGVLPPNKNISFKDKVYFDNDFRYKLNGELCNGVLTLSIAGYQNANVVKNYFFLEGVMMKSFYDYLLAIEFCKINFGEDYEGEVYPFYLAEYSTTPVPMDWEDSQTGESGVILYSWDEKECKEVEFDGKFSPYFTFTKEVYDVEDGIIMEWSKYSVKNEYIQSQMSFKKKKKIMEGEISDEDLREMINEDLR